MVELLKKCARELQSLYMSCNVCRPPANCAEFVASPPFAGLPPFVGR
jgi:hypothetical protein